ncbi:hypothetical protein [Piscinibacter sp.]|uniref:hypothetical protein n=1 Tax=Piscinibacter sp. TaxID=1903157 RepID=UPI0039E5B445
MKKIPTSALVAGGGALCAISFFFVILFHKNDIGVAVRSYTPAQAPRQISSAASSAGAVHVVAAPVAKALAPIGMGDVASRWRTARAGYSADANWAARIQQALSAPTPEGLFYALHTLQLCDAAKTFASMNWPTVASCSLALEYHESLGADLSEATQLAVVRR